MARATLYLYFKDSAGNTQKVTIKDVREDISNSEASELADAIISKNMFTIKNAKLVQHLRSEVEISEVTVL
ncbi:MAG: DUF2922 domain-containing protein [Oscillospiraceae bacterium]|nr:DUF2922 domain-containing protein [Oscillospiraceae bacterium]